MEKRLNFIINELAIAKAQLEVNLADIKYENSQLRSQLEKEKKSKDKNQKEKNTEEI